jgi:hypothetical protein
MIRSDRHVHVLKINAENKTVVVDPATPPCYDLQKNSRFYGYNILKELDTEGKKSIFDE